MNSFIKVLLLFFKKTHAFMAFISFEFSYPFWLFVDAALKSSVKKVFVCRWQKNKLEKREDIENFLCLTMSF
jgi:uncharacterized membrane protein